MKIQKERIETIAKQLKRYNTDSVEVAAAAMNVAMLELVSDKLDELIAKIDTWHPVVEEPVIEEPVIEEPVAKKSLVQKLLGR